MMQPILISLLAIFLTTSTLISEEKVEVQLDNWELGNQDLIVGFKEVIKIGEIEEDGTLIIPLPDNYLEKQRKMMEEINKENKDGWQVSAKTLKSMYGCMMSDLDYSNPDLELAGFGTLGGYRVAKIDEKQMSGVIFPADNIEFAKFELSMGKKDAVKGFTIKFVYADKDASVKGKCESNGFTKVTTTYKKIENYNIELKEGWNIVKYSVDELFEDKEGNLYPAEVSYKNIEEFPETMEWFFIDKL